MKNLLFCISLIIFFTSYSACGKSPWVEIDSDNNQEHLLNLESLNFNFSNDIVQFTFRTNLKEENKFGHIAAENDMTTDCTDSKVLKVKYNVLEMFFKDGTSESVDYSPTKIKWEKIKEDTIMHRVIDTVCKAYFISFNAKDEYQICRNSKSNINICDEAKKIQKEVSSTLPQQISKNILVRSISASLNVLTLHAKLLYSREYLENAVKKGGITMSKVEKQMYEMTNNIVCTQPPLELFINLGGIINYQYIFENGESYLSIPVNTC